MPLMNDSGPIGFFKSLHADFTATLTERQNDEDLIECLLEEAFGRFEGNVNAQAEGLPSVACREGCATCCTIRVTATAPEIILIANHLRASGAADVMQRLADADNATRGLDDLERMSLGRECPFVINGSCAIYAVRPLACRGHASYDERACISALAGQDDSVPLSSPHLMVRSFVQNSMQSALRDAGYAWGAYELNQALRLALQDEDQGEAWKSGKDVFADALVGEISLREMGQTFDAIKAHA